MDNEITICSYAKINLSIDVTGVRDNGMHEVDMIMQSISLHDDVSVRMTSGKGSVRVQTNRPYLPVDRRNLAFAAAELMINKLGLKDRDISIDITKRIPVAAGLAGGSSNAAAVMHAVNTMTGSGVSLGEMCNLSVRLGSDVPFCLVSQARGNYRLSRRIKKDPAASSCARARGIGTELTPIRGIRAWVVIAKPKGGVSTAEVYKGIDRCTIKARPDNSRLANAMRSDSDKDVGAGMINVLECYTLRKYPDVSELKALMSRIMPGSTVLMSGSGPTVFALAADVGTVRSASALLRKKRYEAYWCKTMR